jgi:site-specific DNA-methyltransferase (adenine-specific)
MNIYYENDNGTLLNCDVLEGLRSLPDNSVDSIVTDPPYGISFMNQGWDYDIPPVEVWKEALRVLKPGGYAVIACGTRTQHRMTVNIEDAGFEIRDVIAWVYASGFPKSKDLSAILSGFGTALKPAMEMWTLCRKPLSEKNLEENLTTWGTGGVNIDGCRVPLKPVDESQVRTMKRGQRPADGFGMNSTGDDEGNVCRADGRHPANLIHDGSGEVLEHFPDGKGQLVQKVYKEKSAKFDGIYHNGKVYQNEDRDVQPAKDELGSAARFYYCAKPSRAEKDAGLDMLPDMPVCISNGAQAGVENPDYKPNSIGINKVKYVKNFHTTIKPIELMRYLCRMVTPPKGVVLDPYLGSGTTAIGAVMEYFKYIGIEEHPGYCAIAMHRIEHWMPSFLERYFAEEVQG